MNERTYIKFLRMLQRDIEIITHDRLAGVKGANDAISLLVEMHYRITNLIKVIEWIIYDDERGEKL